MHLKKSETDVPDGERTSVVDSELASGCDRGNGERRDERGLHDERISDEIVRTERDRCSVEKPLSCPLDYILMKILQ